MKQLVKEVCLIRLVLIVLLVLYHSFAPFVGAWEPIGDASSVYWWIGSLAYSCMLECFTLISGWIYGVQYNTKGPEILNYRYLIKNKVKRLLIPSIIFSLIYLLIFNQDLLSKPFSFIYSIIEGSGHMWYLPMLFWCFIGTAFIEKKGLKLNQGIIMLILLSLLSFFQLPLRLNYTMEYMLFFYFGYLIGKGRFNIKKFAKPKYMIYFGLGYLFVFTVSKAYLIPVMQIFKSYSTESMILGALTIRILHLVYSLSGVISIILISICIINKKPDVLSNFWISLGTCTFGIYLFQQFILKLLYYHTEILFSLPESLIPWVAFGITLILSYVFTIILKHYRWGHYLVG